MTAQNFFVWEVAPGEMNCDLCAAILSLFTRGFFVPERG